MNSFFLHPVFSSFPAGGLNAVRLIILPKGFKVCGHRAAGAVPEDKGVERWGKVQRKKPPVFKRGAKKKIPGAV